MSERSKEPVLKTGVGLVLTVGSNPTLSAILLGPSVSASGCGTCDSFSIADWPTALKMSSLPCSSGLPFSLCRSRRDAHGITDDGMTLRNHEGNGSVTPPDVYCGRWERISDP